MFRLKLRFKSHILNEIKFKYACICRVDPILKRCLYKIELNPTQILRIYFNSLIDNVLNTIGYFHQYLKTS